MSAITSQQITDAAIKRFTPEWLRRAENIDFRIGFYIVAYVLWCDHDSFGPNAASGSYNGTPELCSPTDEPAFWYYDIETDQPIWIALKPSHGFYKTVFEDYAR